MSARAPAVRDRKKRGRREDATIQPTHVLDPVNSNISHEAATAWMNVPEAESTVAPHNERKCGYLRGATADVIPAA
jgi:hypothetical protein